MYNTDIDIVPCLLKVLMFGESVYWQKVLHIVALSARGLSASALNTLSFGNMEVSISTYIKDIEHNICCTKCTHELPLIEQS